MLNHTALPMCYVSHLYYSLLPSVTQYPYNQTLFSFVFSSTRMDSSRRNVSKVHTFRRSHIKTFYMVEVGINNIKFQKFSGKFFSFIENCLCKYLEQFQACYSLRSSLARPAASLEELSAQRSLLLQGEKWNCGFLNKWISFKWFLVFLNASLKYLWRHTKMKIRNTGEN